ncbi:MAG: hypothetical protein KAR00_01525 [Candidatus Pacebacteria bacterium]|nr:hypothetical protein [Candidatus Paceibacterota bacterium]
MGYFFLVVGILILLRVMGAPVLKTQEMVAFWVYITLLTTWGLVAKGYLLPPVLFWISWFYVSCFIFALIFLCFEVGKYATKLEYGSTLDT